MSISITGLQAALARLRALEDALPEATGAALAGEARSIRQAARRLCPRQTGELAQSIALRINAGEGVTSASIGTKAEHANFVEFGTASMPAQPFLYSALKTNEANVVSAIEQAVRDVM